MNRGTQFWRNLYYDLANEVEQVLGKALGYPKYCDDQKNFPGTTEEDGVCTGEHVPESILAEAARKLVQKSLVFDESCNVPCTAELEVKLGKLAKNLEGDADYYDREYHTYEKEYAKGSAYAYGRAAEKLREILGWDKR